MLRLFGSVLTLIGAAAIVSSCQKEVSLDAPRSPTNIVLIVVDTLRADRLGAQRNSVPITPFLDAMAKQSRLFLDARAQSTFTRESVNTIMTGQYPSCAGPTGWFAHPNPEAPTLGKLLRERGYWTAFASNTNMLSHDAYTAGFDHVDQVSAWGVSRHSRKLSARAVEALDGRNAKPFLLYVHYLDPHGPYQPETEILRRFHPKRPTHPVQLYGEVREQADELIAGGFGPGEPRFEDFVARYDAEIAHVDESIAYLIERLRALGHLDNTAVLLTSDHGEEFLEHDFVEHAWTLFDESLRVPLMLWFPERVAPARIEQPVSHVDLLPTILELIGAPDAVAAGAGLSLLRDDLGDRPIISELLVESRATLRSVVHGGKKYLGIQYWLSPPTRSQQLRAGRRLAKESVGTVNINAPPAREMLFDLKTDPGELRDLSASEPDTLAAFRGILAAHQQRCKATRRADEESISATEREALKALGYVE